MRFFSLISNLLLLIPTALYSLSKLFFHPVKHKKIKSMGRSTKQLSQAFPETFGFSQSIFQDEGVGTYASPTKLKGICNWDKWLSSPHIEGMGPASSEYRKFFVRILSDPLPFVGILQKMGVNAHRFSFEWAVLEPEKGKIDPEALKLYRTFIRELKNAGIEPWCTLHHFVLPEWAQEEGGFANEEICDHFVRHSLNMMALFPEVSYWLTFNEPAVFAMQSYIRGVYPPGEKGNLAKAGRVLRNLLIAHCSLYRKAKELFGSSKQIGIAHQWLKFVPLNKGNPLERLICYFLSKIAHYSVYNFFKTGKFAYEVIGKANVHLEIPENEFQEQHRFLDFIAPQFYGFPRFKMGWNRGKTYPGFKVMNFNFWKWGITIGNTCSAGGKMQAFGPNYDPESLRVCLLEAAILGPIAITETGCDAMIQRHGGLESNFTLDEATQKAYFQDIAPILQEFKDKILAIFVWTLIRGQLEWDRGDVCSLGLIPLIVDEDRRIIGHRMTPGAELLQNIYLAKKTNPRESTRNRRSGPGRRVKRRIPKQALLQSFNPLP